MEILVFVTERQEHSFASESSSHNLMTVCPQQTNLKWKTTHMYISYVTIWF